MKGEDSLRKIMVKAKMVSEYICDAKTAREKLEQYKECECLTCTTVSVEMKIAAALFESSAKRLMDDPADWNRLVVAFKEFINESGRQDNGGTKG